MRHAILPFAGWLGALQSVAPAGATADTVARVHSCLARITACLDHCDLRRTHATSSVSS
jgi:hypothetical protein